jgi:hypothetical protein
MGKIAMGFIQCCIVLAILKALIPFFIIFVIIFILFSKRVTRGD